MTYLNLSPTAVVQNLGYNLSMLHRTDSDKYPTLSNLIAGLTGQDEYFSDPDAATPATLGDPVHILRCSHEDMRAPHADARPVLRQDGELNYLEFDGADDEILTTEDAITLPDDVTIALLFRTTEDAAIILSDDDAGQYFGMFEDGDSRGVHTLGSLTFLVDGSAFTGNRDALHALVSTGEWIAIIGGGGDMSAWRKLGISSYPDTSGRSFRFSGDIAAAFVLSGSAPEQMAEATAYLDYLKSLAS